MDNNIARILLKPSLETKGNRKSRGSSSLLDPDLLIDLFPGPALLLSADLEVIRHNIHSQNLIESLEAKNPILKSLVSRCLNNNCPDMQKATLNDSKGLRHFDLYAFPVPAKKKKDKTSVFLFGKETTVENNLTQALVESRQMFKDLVNCSSDFAWETDTTGCFNYVSPRGILGYTAYELNGKNASDLIIDNEGKNPFDTLDALQDMEVWVQRSDDSKACILVSALPILDNATKWQGARGVCRDITHIREREAVLRKSRAREHVLNKIVSSIRDVATPSEMLSATMSATLEGIQADYCCIIQMRKAPDGRMSADVKCQSGSLKDEDHLFTLCQKAITLWQDPEMSSHQGAVSEITAGQNLLTGLTHHHGLVNGVMFLLRNDLEKGWNDDEIMLYNGITNQLGIALEQMRNHEELERLARTDELTGLLNRRAFVSEVSNRLAVQNRSHEKGAILYIDLDNFKQVNDTKGHAKGDQILKILSSHIQDIIRVGDYAGRIGGDEFVMWLEDISPEEVKTKAAMLQTISPQINKIADLDDINSPLSLSIGISMSKPEQAVSIEQLLKEADTALYHIKNKGKGSFAFFDPVNISSTLTPEGENK